MRERLHRHAGDWVEAACTYKRLAPDANLRAEEWLSGPWAALHALRGYLRALRSLEAGRGVPLPPAGTGDAERTIYRVYPRDLYDRLLLPGITADVWMEPGVTPAQAQARAAQAYRAPVAPGITLVLGAGNISSIPFLDALDALIAHRSVCLVKMNPVNEVLAPVFARIFEPLAAEGFVAVTTGDAAAGAALTADPRVWRIHVTGSERTHDAIRYGTGPDAADRKRRDDPLLRTPISSELGNVTPTIVLPGRWSDTEIRFQAEQIALQKAHNAGFNCIAAQVLILPAAWAAADALRAAVATALARIEPRAAYYPGATERLAQLAPGAREPYPIVDLDAGDTDHPLFTQEAFCGALACVRLPGDFDAYAEGAVAFANERLYGTLGANVVVHPQTEQIRAETVARTIAQLRYGCIAVNTWAGIGYSISEAPWGAYPGNTPQHAGSGIGTVHNTLLLEGTEKTVLRAPFSLPIKPPWFPTHRNAARVGERITDFEYRRTPIALARVLAAALRA